MYRVKQFIWAIEGSLKEVDYNYLKKYLNDEEISLFKKLKKSEQHHSIRVCENALMKCEKENLEKQKIGKIALLHDVGKIKGPLTIIEKSIIVILDKITKSKLKKYSRNKKVYSYYNHPIESVKLLKELNEYEEEFLYIIENHHKKIDEEDSDYLRVIKESDDLS